MYQALIIFTNKIITISSLRKTTLIEDLVELDFYNQELIFLFYF